MTLLCLQYGKRISYFLLSVIHGGMQLIVSRRVDG
jgi:hypothetical protein